MLQTPNLAKLKERVATKKVAIQKGPKAAGPKKPAATGGMAPSWGEILMGALLISGLLTLIKGDYKNETPPRN